MKRALVCGAGGFIGSHLVKRLKREGLWVRGVDLKYPRFGETEADDFIVGDLRDINTCHDAVDCRFDEIYQLAADMGGAGYIFTGENDADVMHNSAQINLNVLEACRPAQFEAHLLFLLGLHLSRAHPARSNNPGLRRSDAYPAAPDSEYGWEKLFSERLYLAYAATTASRSHRPLSQYLRSGGRLERRHGEGAGRDVPQGRRGATTARSRSGATASRRDRSSISTNASRARCG